MQKCPMPILIKGKGQLVAESSLHSAVRTESQEDEWLIPVIRTEEIFC